MATVLCLSSQVARGYVGGTASRVALERLGHEAWLLPSVILSNHPGHVRFAGEQVPTGRLRAMIEALADNGWLGEVDALLTGYLPTPDHVALAADLAERVRAANREALILCDPILGDDPGGLYLDEDAAAALRDELLPLADMATPNRFELAWLSGIDVTTPAQAAQAAAALPPACVIASSIPAYRADRVRDLLRDTDGTCSAEATLRDHAPHGVGDLMAALFLGHRLNGVPPSEALARASAAVQAALGVSGAGDELRLTAPGADWHTAPAAILDR